MNAKELNNQIRHAYRDKIANLLIEDSKVVLIIGQNELCVPCVDAKGNEKSIIVSVRVSPKSKDQIYSEYKNRENIQRVKNEIKELEKELERRENELNKSNQ